MWYEILVEKYSNNSQFNEQKAKQIHKRTFACVLKPYSAPSFAATRAS